MKKWKCIQLSGKSSPKIDRLSLLWLKYHNDIAQKRQEIVVLEKKIGLLEEMEKEAKKLNNPAVHGGGK